MKHATAATIASRIVAPKNETGSNEREPTSSFRSQNEITTAPTKPNPMPIAVGPIPLPIT